MDLWIRIIQQRLQYINALPKELAYFVQIQIVQFTKNQKLFDSEQNENR